MPAGPAWIMRSTSYQIHLLRPDCLHLQDASHPIQLLDLVRQLVHQLTQGRIAQDRKPSRKSSIRFSGKWTL